jgi:y4mF family transcriptional regulator
MAMTPSFFVWTSSTELGVAVLSARKAMSLNQAELAERAGVSRTFVWQLERGKGSLRVDKVAAVLTAVGLVPLLLPIEILPQLRR